MQGLSQAGFLGTARQMFQLGALWQGVPNTINGFAISQAGMSLLYIIILIIAEIFTRKEAGTVRIMKFPLIVRWIGYLVFASLLKLGWTMGTSEFIYFVF